MIAVTNNPQVPQIQNTSYAGATAFNAPQAASTASFDPCQAQQVSASGLQGAQQLGQQFNGMVSSAPNVAVIDDFSTSNHGQEISGIIQSGGANTQGYDVTQNGGGASGVASALDNVIQQARSGKHFDAVNLSQQNFQASPATQAVQQRIQVLEQMGIPVVVAAGNGGPGQTNQYAIGASFVAASGSVDSGLGNVRGAGQTTSQAAANVTAQVARMHSQR